MSTKHTNQKRENKMKTITLSLVLGLFLTAPLFAQDTVFFSGFEGLEDDLLVFEPTDLNGATDQVGEWSGNEFPEGQGDILIPVDSVGVLPSPYGGKLLVFGSTNW